MRVSISWAAVRRGMCAVGLHRPRTVMWTQSRVKRCDWCGGVWRWVPYEEVYNESAARGRWRKVKR